MTIIVTDFGTDRIAISRPIRAAIDGDRQVFFPPLNTNEGPDGDGAYVIDAPITALADCDGITLKGVPGKSKLKIVVKNGHGLNIGGAQNLTFEGLTFFSTDDGDAAERAMIDLNAAGQAASCSFVRILHCEFHHFKITAWRFSANTTNYFWSNDNYVHDIKTQNQILGDANLADRVATGVSMSHISSASYIGNHIKNIDPTHAARGSRSMYLSGGIVSDILVQGNTIENSGAIKIGPQTPENGAEVRRVTIIGNSLKDCSGAGINLAVNVYDATIIGNTLTSSSQSPGGWIDVGMEGGPAENVTIANNIFDCNEQKLTGMRINNARHVLIEGNTFYGSIGGGDFTGIKVFGDAYIDIRNNQIRECFDYGIVVERAVKGCAIHANRIVDPIRGGVDIRNTDGDVTVTDNDFDLPEPSVTAEVIAVKVDTAGKKTGRIVAKDNCVLGPRFSLVFVHENNPVRVLVQENLIQRTGIIANHVGSGTLLLSNRFIDDDSLVELPFAEEVTPNVLSFPGDYKLILRGDCRLAAPLYGGAAGKVITIQIFQDAVGNHEIDWDLAYKFPPDVRVAQSANAFANFSFRYNGRHWLLIGGTI